MNDIIKKALKELNEEGLLEGSKITEQGKREAEKIISQNQKIQDKMFKSFLKKLESVFYEAEPKEFILKVLKTEQILKKSNIDFYERLKSFFYSS